MGQTDDSDQFSFTVANLSFPHADLKLIMVRCRGLTLLHFPPDAASQLPHFSSPDLVGKYAVVERLNYAYYLRHGRPSFAFGTFLVQELTKSKTPKQL